MNRVAFQLLVKMLVGTLMVLALVFAPLSSMASADQMNMAPMEMSKSVSTAPCKAETCACQKTKSSCDMKLGCAVGCIGYNATPAAPNSDQHFALSEVAFARYSEALVPFEATPLRRPPRV